MEKRRKIWYAPFKDQAYGEEEIKAVEDSLRDGWLGGQGPRSKEFERQIAVFFAVNSLLVLFDLYLSNYSIFDY